MKTLNIDIPNFEKSLPKIVNSFFVFILSAIISMNTNAQTDLTSQATLNCASCDALTDGNSATFVQHNSGGHYTKFTFPSSVDIVGIMIVTDANINSSDFTLYDTDHNQIFYIPQLNTFVPCNLTLSSFFYESYSSNSYKEFEIIIYGAGGTPWLSGANGNKYYTGGKVGIGTNDPQSILHVVDEGRTTMKIGGPANAYGANGDLLFISSDNNKIGDARYWCWSFRSDDYWSDEMGDFALYSHNGSTKPYTSPIIAQADGDVLLVTGRRANRFGNVGIGTTDPKNAKLTITSNAANLLRLENNSNGGESTLRFRTKSSGGNYFHADISAYSTDISSDVGYLGFKVPYNNTAGSGYKMIINSEGNVGIGATTPDAKLHVYGTNAGINNTLASIMIGKNNGPEIEAIQASGDDDVQDLAFRVKSSYTNADDNFEALRIRYNGNVGIGTDSPDYKLDVAGTIRACEVKVDLASGECPDYVFANDYNLMPLDKLQNFIDENSHLPEVKPAVKMEAEGMDLKEMNVLLLKKVEELTLYVLQQQKEINELKTEIRK